MDSIRVHSRYLRIRFVFLRVTSWIKQNAPAPLQGREREHPWYHPSDTPHLRGPAALDPLTPDGRSGLRGESIAFSRRLGSELLRVTACGGSQSVATDPCPCPRAYSLRRRL